MWEKEGNHLWFAQKHTRSISNTHFDYKGIREIVEYAQTSRECQVIEDYEELKEWWENEE